MADEAERTTASDDTGTSDAPVHVPAASTKLVIPNRMPEFWEREHRVPQHMAGAEVRRTPYVLRGRDHETAMMAARVHAMPMAVQVISGPPGSGKTSLLRNIGRYAKAKGYRVVELDRSAFDSHTALANAIRGAGSGRERIPDTATVSTGEATDGTLAGIHQGGHASTTHTHDLEQAELWMNAIRDESAAPGHRGLLILLDEVQRLRDKQMDPKQLSRVADFLDFMHNTVLNDPQGGRSEPGLRAMLICAGMPNAEQTLIKFGLTRVEGQHILHMGPISDQAGRQIIMDHMTAATDDGQPLPQLPAAVIEELLHMCGGYAHHISHAAQNAQRYANNAMLEGRNRLSDEDVDNIVAETRAAKLQHYGGRVRETSPKPIKREVQIVAQATESWGHQLPAAELQRLTDRITEQPNAKTDDLLRDMIAFGILEHRRLGSGYPTAVLPKGEDRAHYVFPIRSMQEWLLQSMAEDSQAQKTRRSNQQIIDTASPPIPEANRIPAWGWDHSKALTALELLPPDELHPPVTGREAWGSVSSHRPRAFQ